MNTKQPVQDVRITHTLHDGDKSLRVRMYDGRILDSGGCEIGAYGLTWWHGEPMLSEIRLHDRQYTSPRTVWVECVGAA